MINKAEYNDKQYDFLVYKATADCFNPSAKVDALEAAYRKALIEIDELKAEIQRIAESNAETLETIKQAGNLANKG